jgi:hypothetical protein
LNKHLVLAPISPVDNQSRSQLLVFVKVYQDRLETKEIWPNSCFKFCYTRFKQYIGIFLNQLSQSLIEQKTGFECETAVVLGLASLEGQGWIISFSNSASSL